MNSGGYQFDRYLRYDELVAWLEQLAADHSDLVSVEPYGASYEGRPLLLVTVTDRSTGAHDTKPAHWIDASIHAVELTATVAACRVLRRLVDGFGAGDERYVRALRTRTFYVVPRVNPDGAEWAMADRPRFRRSSTRPWPLTDGHRLPGLAEEDIDGDGRILQMRIEDPDGSWTPHPEEPRLLVPVPLAGVDPAAPRYTVLYEGSVADFDGFAIPASKPAEGLDLNRNFPAGWSTMVRGAGPYPLSEPEIDALVRAMAARPNICGANAFHTSGGVLLRPSSTMADDKLPPRDVWVWKQLAAEGTAITGYPCHSLYEDFIFDRSETMSGASDDWAYEHLGVFAWTTEFWDIIHAATGTKQSTHFWYTGPTDEELLAVLRWLDDQPTGDERSTGYVDWYRFEHPQLGAVELGGWNDLHTWVNPPPHLLAAEVEPQADFAVAQALAAPCVAIRHVAARRLGDDSWRVEVGVANSGWLPTNVTDRATTNGIAKPVTAEITGDSVEVVDGPARRELGQLAGSSAVRLERMAGTPPTRVLCSWVVRAAPGTVVDVAVGHDRSGRASDRLVLE